MKLTTRVTEGPYEGYHDIALDVPGFYRDRTAKGAEERFIADAVVALTNDTTPAILWHEGHYSVVYRSHPTAAQWFVSFPRKAGEPMPAGGTTGKDYSTRRDAELDAMSGLKAYVACTTVEAR